jgi:hypothetical protein
MRGISQIWLQIQEGSRKVYRYPKSSDFNFSITLNNNNCLHYLSFASFHFITFTPHWEGCEHFVGYLKGEKKREILILFTWVPQCDNHLIN